MFRAGDTEVHFQKLKATQLAEIRSALQKRPAGKFSSGLSPEAQAAMQQAAEETKIQEANKKGKRSSKGNVLFNDTVQIHQAAKALPSQSRRSSCSDIFENAQLDSNYTSHIGALLEAEMGELDESISPRRYHGRRRSSVSKWVQKRENVTGTSNSVDEVEEVVSANLVVNEPAGETVTSIKSQEKN